MKILVAEDDRGTRLLVARLLKRMGHQPIECDNGNEALHILQGPAAPPMAILDWMMGGFTGVEVVRKIRQESSLLETYLILLTMKDSKTEIVEGLNAGANDYITKPFDGAELKARIQIGLKSLEILSELRVLRGLLPICGWCKKIKNEKGYWESVEAYFAKHSEVSFTHGICQTCKERVMKESS